MKKPISIEEILAEYSPETKAWVIQDEKSKRYIALPHPKYPKQNSIYLFISRSKSGLLVMEIINIHWAQKHSNSYHFKTNLIHRMVNITKRGNPRQIDNILLIPLKKVYELLC